MILIIFNTTFLKKYKIDINSFMTRVETDIVKDEIKRCEGTQFDPQVAEVFLDILNNNYEKIEEIQDKYVS